MVYKYCHGFWIMFWGQYLPKYTKLNSLINAPASWKLVKKTSPASANIPFMWFRFETLRVITWSLRNSPVLSPVLPELSTGASSSTHPQSRRLLRPPAPEKWDTLFPSLLCKCSRGEGKRRELWMRGAERGRLGEKTLLRAWCQEHERF